MMKKYNMWRISWVIIAALFIIGFSTGLRRLNSSNNSVVLNKKTFTSIITPSESTLLSNEKIKPLLSEIINGISLSPEEKEGWQKIFLQYGNKLKRKYRTENYDFPEPARSEFYINAMKMAIIYPEQHAGWPFRSRLSRCVFDGLKMKMEKTDDPFLSFCAVFPALYEHKKNYAIKCFDKLIDTQPLLAIAIMNWSDQSYKDAYWIVNYYIENGMADKAEQSVNIAVVHEDAYWLRTKSRFLERMGKYTQAETCLKKLAENYGRINELVSFYMRYQSETDYNDVCFKKEYSEFKDRYFPDGIKQVGIDYFSDPPESGIILRSESDLSRKYGIRRGAIIVAINGYLAENLEQYSIIRIEYSLSRGMDMVVWDNNRYFDVTNALVPFDLFGVDIISYKREK